MGIYDIFKTAAAGAEKIPWRWRLLTGAGAGAAVGAVSGDENTPLATRMMTGAVVGTGLGIAAGTVIRGAGGLTAGVAGIGKTAIAGKTAAVRSQGFKALMKPGTLMLGGAVAGAVIAPEGHRMQGAAIGAGVGLAVIPGKKMYEGFEAIGRAPGAKGRANAVLKAGGPGAEAKAAAIMKEKGFPGLQTGAIIAASAVPLAASVAFGKDTPEGSANAIPGIGATIDYAPLSGNMQDRMFAMNASGDITLGLNNRRHG
jgi:hypothetical protein